VPDFVHVTEDAGRLLADKRVALIGIDYLSIGGPTHGAETHRALLKAGVTILEGLNLGAVTPGAFEMVALPILIPGSDGAPARVLLRSIVS
jgi:arylformamidase